MAQIVFHRHFPVDGLPARLVVEQKVEFAKGAFTVADHDAAAMKPDLRQMPQPVFHQLLETGPKPPIGAPGQPVQQRLRIPIQRLQPVEMRAQLDLAPRIIHHAACPGTMPRIDQ